MKKFFAFLSCLTVLAVGAMTINYDYIQANAESNTPTDEWRVDGGNTKITPVENGTQFTDLESWGASSSYTRKVKVDGLEFKYVASELNADDMLGFYFTKGTGKFYDGTTMVTNFKYKIGYAPSQTRIFVNTSHDYNQAIISYTKPDTASAKGFSGPAESLVSNNDADKVGAVVKFVKHNEEFYKMTLTEITKNMFWGNNANYETNAEGYASCSTYVPTSFLGLDENGDSYLNIWGIKSAENSHPVTTVTNLSDTHIKAAVTFANKVINELACDSTGKTAPSVEEWNALKTSYAALDATEKSYINSATRNETIKAALTKYDYIINKYDTGYEDFLTRKASASSNVSNSINTNIAIISVVISILAITAICALLFLRKKSTAK